MKPEGKALISKSAVKPVTGFLQIDTTKIYARRFNQGALDKYRNNPEFNYQTATGKASSWWDRFWQWLWHILENLFNSSKTTHTSTPGSYIGYILLAGAVSLAVYLIIKVAGLQNIFVREPKQIQIPYSGTIEDIHKTTFDEEIEKAISQRNYRLAIRLMYLSCLKQLDDIKLISWQIEKTNWDYINELTDNEQRRFFIKLTNQFEYVWYGEFPVDGKSFQNINILFADFKKLLA